VYTFVIVRAALELIPKALWNHPAVKKWAETRRKHPSKMLLDQTLHFSAMRKLKNFENRGRADILHRALLTILDSRLSRRGLVSAIIIHTIEERYFIVKPNVRIPRHYFRFMGVMEDLLQRGVIQADNGEILMWEVASLDQILREFSISYIICLEVWGERKRIIDILQQIKVNVAIIIGAAPHENIPEKFLKMANSIIEIDSERLTTSYVLCNLIVELERYHGIVS